MIHIQTPVPFVFYALMSVDTSRLPRVNMLWTSRKAYILIMFALRIGKSQLSHLEGLVCWYSIVFMSRNLMKRPKLTKKSSLTRMICVAKALCTFYLVLSSIFVQKQLQTHQYSHIAALDDIFLYYDEHGQCHILCPAAINLSTKTLFE